MAIGPRDWGIDISWDIADIVWSSDQTTIDSRSRLTVQLRQDVLDQVTNLYFQRQRLKVELMLMSSAPQREKLYKQLEFEEVTANLDAMTDGYFSRNLQKN